jgi:putative endonuclease
METKTNNTTNKGKYFEAKAVDFLQSNGFRIIEQNYHAKKLGEIDIIAQKKDVYHFVEVKSGESFEAVYNITPQKLYKLYRAIDYYLKEKKLDVAYCIDAIIFANEELEYLENITL